MIREQRKKLMRILQTLPLESQKSLAELAKSDPAQLKAALIELLRTSVAIESGNAILWERTKRRWNQELLQLP